MIVEDKEEVDNDDEVTESNCDRTVMTGTTSTHDNSTHNAGQIQIEEDRSKRTVSWADVVRSNATKNTRVDTNIKMQRKTSLNKKYGMSRTAHSFNRTQSDNVTARD